jgi:DNA (cytosine-5)-methyltransferase 1
MSNLIDGGSRAGVVTGPFSGAARRPGDSSRLASEHQPLAGRVIRGRALPCRCCPVALRSASLCAGIGALDCGVKLARPDHRLVVAVERQAYCAAVLVARMADASLDGCPIWSDLASFDGRPWRGAVDLVTAGYPCQPESTAGRRRGLADERWLWHEVWRCIREMGPRYVFLENVAAHLSGTFGRVLGDMAASGWRIEWDCIPAATVGAPHLRDRLFVLAADPDRDPVRLESRRRGRGESRPGPSGPTDAGARRIATDDDDERCEGERSGGVLDCERAALGHDADGCGRAEVAHADWAGWTPQQLAHGVESEARRPAALVAERHQDGWPTPPEPTFHRVDDGPAAELDRDWADRVHAIGNAVVPQAAARAWDVLWARLHG